MTFAEYVLKHLITCGMSDKDAETVLKVFIEHPAQTPIIGRWNDKITDYPSVMQNMLIIGLNRITSEWIAKHQPEAWYRGMFNGEAIKQYQERFGDGPGESDMTPMCGDPGDES